jgi:hypothetical protein
MSLREMVHEGSKGTFNELFLTAFLGRFLPDPIGAASGVIVDSEGHQSHQTDVILFDKRICPHLIVASHQVLCPVESVLGTIEVKTRLYNAEAITKSSQDISEFLGAARYCFLKDELDVKGQWPPPLAYFFAFDLKENHDFSELRDQDKGDAWLTASASELKGVNVMGQFSWMVIHGKWQLKDGDRESFEESKRFVAVLVDNMRTLAERRWRWLGADHHDILGAYIRSRPH